MRLRFLVEGQTEESFVNSVLIPHLWNNGVDARTAQKITTSRRRGQVWKGGTVPYQRFLRELVRLLKQDEGAVFTTMIDYYALPGEYMPNGKPPNPNDIEAKIKKDVEKDIGTYPPRIIPYIQQHEFETLLLVRPEEIGFNFDDKKAVAALTAEIQNFTDIEEINLTPAGAPSKRIIRHFPAYEVSKATAGPTIAARIGLPSLRKACPVLIAGLGCWRELADILHLSQYDVVVVATKHSTHHRLPDRGVRFVLD